MSANVGDRQDAVAHCGDSKDVVPNGGCCNSKAKSLNKEEIICRRDSLEWPVQENGKLCCTSKKEEKDDCGDAKKQATTSCRENKSSEGNVKIPCSMNDQRKAKCCNSGEHQSLISEDEKLPCLSVKKSCFKEGIASVPAKETDQVTTTAKDVSDCCSNKNLKSVLAEGKSCSLPPKETDQVTTTAKDVSDCCLNKKLNSLLAEGKSCSIPPKETDQVTTTAKDVSDCCSNKTLKSVLAEGKSCEEGGDRDPSKSCSSSKKRVKACCSEKENLEVSAGNEACCSIKRKGKGYCCTEKGDKEALLNSCCDSKETIQDCCSSEGKNAEPSCCSSEEECCDEVIADETRKLLISSSVPSLGIPSNASVLDEDSPQQTGIATTKLRVQNICCAMEAQLVKDVLAPIDGVINVAVNMIGRVAHVRHDLEIVSVRTLLDSLNKVHLGATVMETGNHHGVEKHVIPLRIKLLLVYIAIQTVLFIVAVVGLFLKTKWFMWVAIAEILFGSIPILKRAFISMKNLRVDINVLMLIAIIGTAALSDWVEGATVVYVFALADAIEEYSLHKVQRTISRLMLKRPQVAVLVETGEVVNIDTVVIGTLIAVRPGDLIPLDGIVVKGRASVDESSITGECLPVEKKVDSKVFSGTVDQNGYLEIKTTTDSSNSTVSRVAEMVQEAQSSSTRTEQIINHFAKYYTPLVVVTSALVIAIPAILGVAGVGTYQQDLHEWGHKALVLLVVACPCALVMTSPIAVVCSITAAARRGSLIKKGEHLETLAKLEVLAFDKTGTLTEGKFQVTDMESVYGVNEREVLRLAAGIESKSSHPIAAAIVNEFSGCVGSMVKSNVFSIPEVKKFKLHEGKGISGIVEGKKVLVGNHSLVTDQCGEKLGSSMTDKYIQWSNESKTVVFVSVNSKVQLMVALADSIRPNTIDALDWLRHHGIQTSMITGDNARTAAAVKESLGLDECTAEMKPSDKLEWIKNRQGLNNDAELTQIRSESPHFCCVRRRNVGRVSVGMVGDGVNDGPALAAADLGIAMGAGGTALAVEAADVTLMSNNLAKIPELVSLGKFCRTIITQNIALSVVLKLALMVVALLGHVDLWMAVLGDALGLIFVILNGLRPLIWKAPKVFTEMTGDVIGLTKTTKKVYLYESIV
ncbi:probable cadmium-transporting ATPase isoform X2 [Nematostella vectensis]|nr:probable cadmium-transporting ATPase isoform X2 [Nematostella vectensis]XP_048587320.1 probable cadmium-transporting ATPase isoform X2 [Nematostella vectensis]XP_048587321.1 probable cadmium-transporting ATPase isoform X2 [Nematostella vectensis]XP_048587322.1 probable cadmium-transporting ATPase isoform X2 [Nematostella vectensis]